MYIQPGSDVAGNATARRLYFLAEGVSLIRPLGLVEIAHVEVVDVSESL